MNGILFHPDIWLAKKKVLDQGDIAVTRRLSGLKEINQERDKWVWNEWQRSQMWCSKFDTFWFDNVSLEAQPRRLEIKPRYHVGQVVYVRERALYWDGGAGGCSHIVYADDPAITRLLEDNNRLLMARETTNILAKERVIGKWQWKSPYAMKTVYARTFLQIVGVRPEFFLGGEMTDADIEAEGGVEVLPFLRKYDQKWLWRIKIKRVEKEIALSGEES